MNKKTLSLSVIIPTFNRSALVDRAIKSVLNQDSYSPLEIIVLDDASIDNTVEVLSKIPEIILYQSPTNVGPSRLRNIGIDMAKGEYLAFLDSDDLWTEHKLKVFSSELEKFHSLGIWTHRSGNLNKGEIILQESEIVPFWKQLLKNHASCPCTIIRKDLNQKFSESLRYNEDHELFTRISFSQNLILNHSVLTLLGRRINEVGGLSGSIWKMRLGEMKTYIKATSYNRKLIPLLPFLLLFSLLKHARLVVRSI